MRKVIRSGATEFAHERSVQPQPKIGPWRDELDRILAENARKPKRDRLTRIRIYEAAIKSDASEKCPSRQTSSAAC